MANDPHPSTAELAYLSIVEINSRFQLGTLTSLQLVNALLERIDALNERAPYELRAVAELCPDVLEQAERRDDERRRNGQAFGPLHGVPVLVKDNVEVKGLLSSSGSLWLEDRCSHDAALVRELRDAGAIILGTTSMAMWSSYHSDNMPEGWSSRWGIPRNPWDKEKTPGESSTGSAVAVAAGLAPLAFGTDTTGSVVIPAALNGVFGLRLDGRRLPTEGIAPVSRAFDAPGPFVRSVDDLRLVLNALDRSPSHSDAPRLACVRHHHLSDPSRSRLVELDAAWEDVVAELEGLATVSRTPEILDYHDLANEFQTVLLYCFADDISSYLDKRTDGVASWFTDLLDEDFDDVDPQPNKEHVYDALSIFNMEDWSARVEKVAERADARLREALGANDVLVGVSHTQVGADHDHNTSFSDELHWLAAAAGWSCVNVPANQLFDTVGILVASPPNRLGALLAAADHVVNAVGQATGQRSFVAPTWHNFSEKGVD
jgi:amidase